MHKEEATFVVKKRGRPIEKQLYLSQLATLVIAVLASLAIALFFSIGEKMHTLDTHIRNTASVIASLPQTREVIRDHYADEEMTAFLDKMRDDLENVDILAIFDLDSIRLYHPRHDWHGTPISGGDQTRMLETGQPYTSTTVGTLGKQRRAFYPVLDENRQMIGYVVAGVLTTSVTQLMLRITLTFLLIFVVLIALGAVATARYTRRLRGILLGHNPEQFRKMYLDRSEVLDAMEEGILAVRSDGQILVMNAAAQRFFNISAASEPPNTFTDIFPDGKLPALPNMLMQEIPLIDGNAISGTVHIFHDHREIARMAEKLTSTEYMLNTMRQYNHDFLNKLHVILGYIEMGQPQAVADLIVHSSIVSTQEVSAVTRSIQTPALAALLIGKIKYANERNVRLTLQHGSHCTEDSLAFPLNVYITLLGNLIDNAIEAVCEESCSVKEIEVGLNAWPGGCIISVDDTGGGIPDDVRNRIFEQNFSTKGDNRGTGLYLVKQIVDSYEGTLSIDSEPGVGTSITITLVTAGGQSCTESSSSKTTPWSQTSPENTSK